jgi:uncharacterized membrane protein
MKKRIWELDAFRGICVIGMVAVHFVYDLTTLYRIVNWNLPTWFEIVKNWGGVLFLLISGISVTLGRHSLRRGALVFGCGLLVSAVTVGMYYLNMAGKGIIIYFGVLQCLGVCMMVWPIFRKLPWWALAVAGCTLAATGLWLKGQPGVDTFWLMPLGLPWKHFASSDYFPLLPNLGFFLLGATLGRTVYKKKESLLPKANENNPIVRFFRLCGKHSLFIYLAHQPILTGVCMAIMALR